jgi:RND family efflux transporter MFP subunit
MAAPSDIRAQLRSLSIPKEQRPTPDAATSVGGRRNGRVGWVIGAILVVAAVAAAYVSRDHLPLISGGAAPSPDVVKLAPVILRHPDESAPLLTATGKIVSDHQVKVATKVSGQIVALNFEQGNLVTKGQVLARIEDVIYRARRDQAAAEVEKAKANLEFQQINYERMKRLHASDNAPDIEWAGAKRAIDEAQAQLDAAKAALDWAQKALVDCEVVAPIAGVILQRNVEVGDFVSAEGGRGAQANAEFGTIADMTTLRVEVDISELDISRISPDLPCTVIPDAYKDRRYRGRVMWIDPGANYSKATVQVKVRIENPDEFLRVEGSAQVVFMAPRDASGPVEAGPSLWIPSSACLVDSDGKAARVFVAVGDRLKATTITLGRRSGAEVQVVSGLSAGQFIVAGGADKLRDGQRIPSARPPG